MAGAAVCETRCGLTRFIPDRQGKPMDLGIRGKSALVCAASKGLGRACAMSLGREGVELTIVARTRDALEAAAEDIRKDSGAKVIAVAADITTPEGRRLAL